MKSLLALVVLLCGLGGRGFAAPVPNATLQPADAKVVGAFITSLARKLGGNVPDEVARTVRTGDLNHDGAPDVAVLFTIEGPGNNYVQHLAVFVRSNGRLVALDQAAVGGKLYRAVGLTSIQDGAIRLTTTGYADKDPACCPTIQGTTEYSLVDNKLKESPHR